jgi:DNA polymerase
MSIAEFLARHGIGSPNARVPTQQKHELQLQQGGPIKIDNEEDTIMNAADIINATSDTGAGGPTRKVFSGVPFAAVAVDLTASGETEMTGIAPQQEHELQLQQGGPIQIDNDEDTNTDADHIVNDAVGRTRRIFSEEPFAAVAVDPTASLDADAQAEMVGIAPGSTDFFYWDVETRSAVELTKGKYGLGVHAYAEHFSTQVLCVAFARGDGPVELWVPSQPLPEAVLAAAADPRCQWVAHNAAFERSVLEHILIPQHGWPTVLRHRHVCTMALSLAHAYPGGLDAVAEILGLLNQKDAARTKEVSQLWKPRKPRHDEDPAEIHWVESEELTRKLHDHNRQDVAIERELHHRLAPLQAAEQDAWVLDAEVNDRGVLIDSPLANAASRLAAHALDDLNARIRHETGGVVDKASNVKKLKEWLERQGIRLPRRLAKQTGGLEGCLETEDIEKLLAGNLPNERVRAVLEIRLHAAQSAASKIDRMLRSRSSDGRVRDIFRFCGATTGRWSGAGFQPQNLKRPVLLRTDEAVAEAIEAVRVGDYAVLKERYRDVLGVIGDLCRSMIIPAPGHRFIVGDFRAIEARVLGFLARDAEKLEAFRRFDRGLGPDIYCVTAEQVLGLRDLHEKSPERQLGKIFELGLGYQMGADRLLAELRKANVSDTGRLSILDTKRWVQNWRCRNPAIVSYWAALNATAMAAVRNPEMAFPCRSVLFEMRAGVLYLRLPSGRELSYPAPEIKPGRFGEQQITFLQMEAGSRKGKQMYGGQWAENVTQAVARDLLVAAMKRLRAAGYAIVMHAHDEVTAEMPRDVGSVEEFQRLLIEVPAWAHGLPIAAKVFECTRFKKD